MQNSLDSQRITVTAEDSNLNPNSHVQSKQIETPFVKQGTIQNYNSGSHPLLPSQTMDHPLQNMTFKPGDNS